MAAIGSVFALLHCGGTVQISADGDAGAGGRGHAGRAGHAGRGILCPAQGQRGDATVRCRFDVYIDPGCPDVGAPTEVNQCDPFSTTPTCPPGEGCFPFVDHPFGEGCGAQSFGTVCREAGTGQQGDSCNGGGQTCAAGFVCVVGSQPGKHCVQLCPLGGLKVCPTGNDLRELDVEGYGVCS
ncbi:MAG: hypothetical protein WDO74_11425 [Pseudomonadota bacterium]